KCQLIVFFPLLGEFEGVSKTTLHTASCVDAFLDGDFVRGSLKYKTACTCIKAFVVFADDDKIYMLGLLVFERAEALVVEFDRPEMDVLLQFKTRPQQDAFLEDSRFDIRMTNGAK